MYTVESQESYEEFSLTFHCLFPSIEKFEVSGRYDAGTPTFHQDILIAKANNF